MKILLVEDDPATRQLLALHLTAARYTVEQATDGRVALDLASQWNYDLILLDLNLPHLDGLSLCRQLRQIGSTTPILILTAQTGDEHVITGLDAGADDYVTKPFDIPSVLARVRALLRRGAVATEIPSLTWGPIQLEPALAQVTYRGHIIPLTPKEYSLLELFLRHPQRIFSRSNILDHLWTLDDSPTEGAVTNLVKDLRNRLKRSGIAETVIQTVYGLGYRLGEPTEPTELAPPSDGKAESGDRSPSSLREAEAAFGPTPTAVPPSSVAAKIATITQQFQSSLPGRLAHLEDALERLLTTGLTDADRRQAVAEAHRLAGGLGTFGDPEGSAQARSLEALLGQPDPLSPDQNAQIVEVFQRLKQTVTATNNLLPPMVSVEVNPHQGRPNLPVQRCNLLLINLETTLSSQFQRYFSQQGYPVEVWANLPEVASTPLNPQVGAVLLGLDPAAPPTTKLAPLRAIRDQYPHLPVLVITSQDSLEERVQVARLQGNRYLVAPISPCQVVEALEQVLPCGRLPESRVLVVDDDTATLATIQDLLSPWGLQVVGLSDPRQFWEQLRQVQPDLLMLALDTPTFSGFDLCQVVRQDPTYGNLPTLMLATRSDTVTVTQVFEAGGDDLIGKPIVGPELVTRVLSRVERSRLRQQLDQMRQQRSLQWDQSDHDPLTQVATIGHFERFLQQQWDRHVQDQAPLALLLCALDDFAAYQQTYGAGASDGVLRRVARTLHHTVNPNIDLVARSGEAQFNILLPNTNLDGALRVATRIQQAIDHLHLPQAIQHRPSMTLSLGIGGAVPCATLEPRHLIVAAEQALGEAQARGGNTLSLYPVSR
ncbi:hypothetical protein GFS31_01840 [Leptolyngbya sp. BL0902]|uniref:response regulator n=1 Tax=Leptolyngbya sp. BL0902 TaxID=1115757 RepID=UPI0018E8E1E5|nr:response regulator [Leptolyngbya sp. BL0902]QQE63519.1 hypothetical protein GFS31_01840 [Leptolyngbya sp. BL0902]